MICASYLTKSTIGLDGIWRTVQIVVLMNLIGLLIALCQDTCEPICFKLGVMLYTCNLCIFILVWMTWIFTRGHKVTKKAELVQSICCAVA